MACGPCDTALYLASTWMKIPPPSHILFLFPAALQAAGAFRIVAHKTIVIRVLWRGWPGSNRRLTASKAVAFTAWRHPCIGGTGGIRTHARLSPPISFQDCSLMTTWVLFHVEEPDEKTPHGAGRRTRTPDLLVTNQLLYL